MTEKSPFESMTPESIKSEMLGRQRKLGALIGHRRADQGENVHSVTILSMR